MNYSQFKECPLYYNLVYPRYISELSDFNFIPVPPEDTEYTGGFVKIDREDELWWQASTYNKDGLVVPLFNFSESFISNDGTETVYYINQLLDDEQCFIHRSCNTWYGNTNRNERVVDMKPCKIVEQWNVDPPSYPRDSSDYTVSLKRIWGFEPDKAESSSDISKGIIDGFSKKKYSVLIYKDGNNEDVFIPTVNGTPLTDIQISDIISTDGSGGTRNNYPNSGSGNLVVSD